MTYSVWNQATGRYDYFVDARSSVETSAPRPGHLSPRNELGVTPEKAAWCLPVDAKPTGHGQVPRGRIASPGRGRGLGVIPDLTIDNLLVVGLLFGLGYYVVKGRLPFTKEA